MVIVSAVTIVMESAFVAVPPRASVTRTVKFDVPAAVGVPEKTPVAESVRPVGRVPAVLAQVNAPEPPDAARGGAL